MFSILAAGMLRVRHQCTRNPLFSAAPTSTPTRGFWPHQHYGFVGGVKFLQREGVRGGSLMFYKDATFPF